MEPQLKSAKETVLVLLAPGFEESLFVHYISSLRANHIPVSLVGLSVHEVKGVHGLAIHPDCSLNQLPGNKDYPLVLVMGGYEYLSSLTADPRVHQLLGNTLKNDGYVATDETAESILPYTNAKNLLTGKGFVRQNKMSHDEYIQHLISLVKKGPLPS